MKLKVFCNLIMFGFNPIIDEKGEMKYLFKKVTTHIPATVYIEAYKILCHTCFQKITKTD